MGIINSTSVITAVRLQEQGGDPAAPGAGYQLLYVKAGGVYAINSASAVVGPLTTDHGALSGLADDDHSQYHNNARGDARYPQLAHTHTGTTDGVKLAQADTHESPDTDSATSSLHHTIGVTATTAAAGNHTHAGALTNPMDSAGDMIIGGVAGAAAKLDAGTSGYHLVAKGATDPAWEAQYSTINFIIDGGGSAITTGVKGDLVIDFACNIVAWTLLADTAGAIKIDIWRDSYANYPPTDADTITNAHEPEIAASGVKEQDTDLSDWITNPPAITAGQTLRINVDSAATITRCTLALKLQRT